MAPTVAGLWRYPVKSCAGNAVSEITLDGRGPVGDRRYMLVDAKGRFVTARECSALLEIGCALDGDSLILSGSGAADCRVTAPVHTPDRAVKVWKDTLTAQSVSAAADAWLTERLGKPVSLVYMGSDVGRPVAGGKGEVSFADGYPLLILSEASLNALNERAGEMFDMRRFRPNIVVSGVPAHGEDDWHLISIGTTELEITGPCPRCVLTTIDPDAREKHPRGEPMRTLKTYRMIGTDGVMFGANAIVRKAGIIRVGDMCRQL